MEMTREQFVAKLVSQGIDESLAESMYKSAVKGAPKKRKGNPAAGESRPKKYVGRFEFTEICMTCGSRTTKRMIMEIDPNKPRSTEVPVNICNACIPRYRAMTQDELISLIILKDHPDVGFRMLNNKGQIKLAKSRTPEDLIHARSDVEPAKDKRHLRPQFDHEPVDMRLVRECQLIYNRAIEKMGPGLEGQNILDILTDETGESLTDIRRVVSHIKKH